ncbi:hypothetical protein B0E51_16845 [Rhodanobacter sp. C05]|nr:hypothetical protein B0E51_16845 [Rhodanobacter sp. C05]
MTTLPKVDTHLPGASCLLCIAAASMANSKLTTYSHSLPEEGLPKLKSDLVELLRKRGVDAIVINEDINVAKLPDAKVKGDDVAKKDFSSFRNKYNIEHLIVIDINEVGFERPYSAYVPSGEPKGVVAGLGYEVSLSNNTYEWYLPLNIQISADGQWDEPPNYPGLTNAYFQALETSKDNLLKPFSG